MKWPFMFRKAAAQREEGSATQPHDPTHSGILLDALGNAMMNPLASLEKGSVDLELVRSRIADFFRDLSRPPMAPDEFMRQATALDTESQRRLVLVVGGLSDGGARSAFAHGVGSTGAVGGVAMLMGFVREQDLLTVALLLESPLRREEFVRRFVALIGGSFRGETREQSAERLSRLDYRALLAEAEKARLSAEDRVAYLKKLQQEQESRLGRRSKI